MIQKSSRRQFLVNSFAVAGTTILIHAWYHQEAQALPRIDKDNPLQRHIKSDDWSQAPGQVKYRYEGLPKVKGDKIYARDFRAQDIPGWPQQELRAMIIKADRYDQRFMELKFDHIPSEFRPFMVVTEEDFSRAGLSIPSFFAPSLLLKKGDFPDYLGQPLAIIYFKDSITFARARSHYGRFKK